MKDMKDPGRFRIIHNPCGIEHPYYSEPDARAPTHPREGEPVILGVVTDPVDSATQVWATWRIGEAGMIHKAHGVSVSRIEDGNVIAEEQRWMIQLPAFQQGETIRYTIHARFDSAVISSQRYTFVVEWLFVPSSLSGYSIKENILALFFCLQSREETMPMASIYECTDEGILKETLYFDREEISSLDTSANPDAEKNPVVLTDSPDILRVAWDHITLCLDKSRLCMSLLDGSGEILIEENRPFALGVAGNGKKGRLTRFFTSMNGEGFYGFGVRYNRLNQRRQRLDVRVVDQYNNQQLRTYLPAPFFLSTRGYGHFINTSRSVLYDLAFNVDDEWSYAVEIDLRKPLELYLFRGAPSCILSNYGRITGKPTLPPDWVFGPWMSSNEWNTQARVMAEVENTLKHDIPATVIVIEAWSDEATFYIWNDAQYTAKKPFEPIEYGDFTFPPNGKWPNPKKMIEELHALGMRVILWQIPVLKKSSSHNAQQKADEDFAVDQGYVVRLSDGRPYRIRPGWFHGGMVLDFTNPEAVDWWFRKRNYLLKECNVDGFKTDGGEQLWGQSLRFYGERKSDEMWNLYPNAYIGAYHDNVESVLGGDGITFSRSGFAGVQKYPCHWAGDQDSTWSAYRSVVLAALNAGISGIPFMGWDIAGFGGKIPAAELYVRSTATAAFCPIMQYHSEYNDHRQPNADRTPWNIAARTGDDRVLSIYRFYAKIRMKLIPYIVQEANHTAEHGTPLMAPLFLGWPMDDKAWSIEDQYCFGRSLLIAPVLEPNVKNRDVYLPEGDWIDVWTGENIKGRKTVSCDVPLDRIPVFRLKEGPWPYSENIFS